MKEFKTSNPSRKAVAYRSTSEMVSGLILKSVACSIELNFSTKTSGKILVLSSKSFFYFITLRYLIEYCHFIWCLDILHLISGFIQLCSSCRLFSSERRWQKAIRCSNFTNSNYRSSLAYLHWKFDHRWNLLGQPSFSSESMFSSSRSLLFIMFLSITSLSHNIKRSKVTWKTTGMGWI